MNKPPADKQTWESELATYWFDGSILVSLSKSPRRTVENLLANSQLVRQITGNRKVPLLIYLADSPMPDKAARRLSKKLLPESYTAMAMVSRPGLAQLIMKVLFSMSAPPIPMKSFTDDEKAKEWLRQYV